MKKFTSLLMLFLVCFGVAQAQTWLKPEVSTATETYEYYLMNYRNQDYFATTTTGLTGGAQQLGSANAFNETKAKVTFKLTADNKLYSTNTGTELILGYTTTGEAANSVQLFAADSQEGYTWKVEVSNNGGYTLSAGTGNNSWNMHGGAGANIGLYRKTDGGSNWVFVPANAAAEAKAAEFKAQNMPSTEYYYQIKNKAYSRMLAANANKATVTSTNSTSDLNQLWAFEQGEDGAFYLRNAGQEKYLGHSTEGNTAWPVVDEANKTAFNVDFVNFVEKIYFIKYVGGDGYSCAHDANWGAGYNYEQVVRWEAAAEASQWIFEKTDIPTDVQEVTFTYSFKYKGVDKGTQTCTGLVGAAYPDVDMSALPYGVAVNKPTGEVAVEVAGTTIEVEVTDNLPFVAAADYASIQNWYYIQMHSNSSYTKYIQAVEGYIEWADATVIANEIDTYTWGFIGNPFDGFKLVNYANGETKGVNSTGSSNPAMGDIATATAWTLKPSASNPTAEYFCFQYPSNNQYMNAQSGKVAFWSSADNGSTMWVIERDFTGRTELQALVAAIEAAAPNYVAGEGIGYYTQASVDAVAAAVAAAKTALAGTMTAAISAQHQTAINNAVAALAVNMPTPGALYRIKNVFRERFVSVGATGNRVSSEENNANASLIWTVEQNGSNYAIKNLNYGDNGYMQSPGDGNNLLVNSTGAAAFTLKPLGSGQFNICVNSDNLVIYSGGGIGVWWGNGKDSDGAWIFEPATELDVTVTSAGYATINLPFAVTLPNTVKAYAAETINDGYVTLTEKADIPANTGALLEGEGTHTLTIAAATSDWTNNKFSGTNVNSFVEGPAYVLSNQEGVVGLYKATLNKNAEGAEGETHFRNNANKAYLPAPVAGARFLGFDFGTETGIGEVETETENAVIFDLAGRRVQKAQKGLYIVNGKKVIK